MTVGGPVQILLALEWLVLDAGWASVVAEFLLAERFVIAEVAFEPAHLRVAFERQDVCGHTVEEPAIVRNHDGATRILFEASFERLKRFDCLLYTSPSPRDQRGSRMPSSA